MSASGVERLPAHLVLYDGVCGFCNAQVQRLVDADREGTLRFAPLQGDTAEAVRQRHPELPRGIDTMVLVERRADGERIHLRSAAIFRVGELVGGPWRRFAWLRFLPRFLTDLGYAIFIRVRYRVFGKLDRCPAPPPGVRDRFLP